MGWPGRCSGKIDRELIRVNEAFSKVIVEKSSKNIIGN